MMDYKKQIGAAQAELSGRDKRLAKLISKYGDCQIEPHTDYYGELVSGIVGQQLSVKAAATIWKRVLAVFGGKIPTTEQLVAADTEKLRACGVSYAKVGYMKDLARHILDGRLDMPHIATLPNEELIKQLTAVKGIGEWSAHMFMIFSLGRLDILPIGDLGIRKAAMAVYELGDLPDKKTLQELSAQNSWSPYESVASWYLWKSLDNK